MISLLLIMFGQFSSIREQEFRSHLGHARFAPAPSERPKTELAGRGRGMHKDYYGYLPYWIDTVYYQDFQMDLLTQVAFFGVEIDPASGDLDPVPNPQNFLKSIDQGHGAGTRVHMTFIIFGSSSVSLFLNNAQARDNAIDNMENFLTDYGIEGVNIDFEFVTAPVRDSFNLFIHDLAERLAAHPTGPKDLYCASIAVPEWYPGYDIPFLADHCRGLFIMGYDFHWTGSAETGPVAPTIPSAFWGQYSIAKSIGDYKRLGVAAEKILLGMPLYGYDWPTVSAGMGSATTGAGSAVIYYYAFQNSQTHGRLWDDYSLTPWYSYYPGNWHQCWYEDSASLDIKCSIVNDSLLGGAGCWALGYDRGYDHIWNTIRRNFWDSTGVAEENDAAVRTPRLPTFFRGTYRLSLPRFAAGGRISLYDMLGRRLLTEKSTGKELVLGQDLGLGVYFLTIEYGAQRINQKIVKIGY